MGCLDSLCNIHLWKYSKLDQIHALATYWGNKQTDGYHLLQAGGQTKWLPEVPSNLNYSIILIHTNANVTDNFHEKSFP